MIMMTASDFMTVAIAMERYVAVHYPLDYNQVRGREKETGQIRLFSFQPCFFISTFSFGLFVESAE
jgi:hypothetical protein